MYDVQTKTQVFLSSLRLNNPKDVGPAIANSNQSLGGEREVFETTFVGTRVKERKAAG
jgi:hypothetical protein